MEDGKGTRAGRPQSAAGDDPGEADSHRRWALLEWPEIDPEVEELVQGLIRAQRYLNQASGDTLKGLGLSHGEVMVLFSLVAGERSHGDIARSLLASTGTITNRLDKLERLGLIQRRPDPQDRRGVLLQLTESGRKTLDQYVSVEAERERNLLRDLSRAELRQLNQLLRKVLLGLRRDLGPPVRPPRDKEAEPQV
jgi:DNA-binding MarR family transcriptional regulator